jgi:hypothetical protein
MQTSHSEEPRDFALNWLACDDKYSVPCAKVAAADACICLCGGAGGFPTEAATRCIGSCAVLPADADLEDDMSDDDMLPARPAPVPVSTNRRVRVVPSSRRRPPLAPGTKAAADGGKQKGATTASGRRSFLTLAVSTGGCISVSLVALAAIVTCNMVTGKVLSQLCRAG